MKTRISLKFSIVASILLMVGAMSVQAANVTKLDTTTMNGGVADWSAAPATTDVGEFGATPTLAHMAAMTLGGNLTLGGLQMDGTTLGPLTVASGNTLTLGTSGINMSAANNNMTFNCALTLGGAQTWNAASGRTLTFGGSSISAGANLLTIAGAGSTSIGATAIISSTGGITKTGGGTFTLNGNTTQHSLGSSTLAVNGGILNLVIPSTGIANIIASTASLSLGGGGFNYSYAVGNSQSFATLTLNPGESALFVSRNGSFNSSVTIAGAITRNTGATLNTRPYDSGREQTVFTSIGTSALLTANGTAYLTMGNPPSGTSADNFNDWGGVNSGHDLIVVSYTSTAASSLGTSAQNANVVVATTTLAANATDASFRDGVNQATTIDLHGNTWTTGGILINSAVATAGSIIKDTVGGGSLKGPAAGADLTVFVSPNAVTPVPFTISANIADNSGTAITKGASGTLVLSGNNAFTGGIYINDGVVQVGSAGALNSTTPNAINFAASGMISGIANNSGGATGGTYASAPTLTLAGFSASVASLSTANYFGGLTPTVQNANATPATLTISGSTTTTFGGVIQNGTGGGALSVTRSGSGTEVLAGANTYTGNTTISGTATLSLGAGGSINNSPNIIVGSGATFDVSAVTGGYTLGGSQDLQGSGTVNGSVNTTGSGSVISGGNYGTLTFNNNLTFASGATAVLNLQPSGLSDEIVVNGSSAGALTFNSTVIHLKAPSTLVNLAAANYTLFNSPNAAISGTPTLAWDVAPANYLSYSLQVNANTIVLVYAAPSGPTVTASSITPNPAYSNETVTVSATVSDIGPGAPVTGVTADVGGIDGTGGPNVVALTPQGGGVWSTTVTVGSVGTVVAGPVTCNIVATDSSTTGTAAPTLTIVSGFPVVTASSITPGSAYPNESVTVSATVPPRSEPIGTVTADLHTITGNPGDTAVSLSPIGGNVYTTTVTVGAAVALGANSGTITATDTFGHAGTASPAVTIVAGNPLITSPAVSPANPQARSGTVTISATVTAQSYPIGSVTATGAGIISGSPVTLSLVSGNLYQATGVTVISGGTVVITAADNETPTPETATANLTLTVGATSDTWAGDGSANAWNNATPANTDWTAASSPTYYLDGDSVTFDSAGLANPAVALGGTVMPASVTFNPGAGNSYTISGAGKISGAATVVNTTGNNTISTVNDFTGGTTITAGTLTIGGAGQLGSGTYSHTIADSGTFDYNSSANQTISGVISGAGNLVKDNTGTLTLTVANTYTGNITVNNGTLADSYGNSAANISASGLGNPQTAGRTVTINNGGTVAFNTGSSGNFLGGSGSTTIALGFIINQGGTLQLNNGNTPVGPITLNGGTMTATTAAGGTAIYYGTYYLNADVTVGGSSRSVISSTSTSANNNINMTINAAGTRTFNVAVTGDPLGDLLVSSPLGNGANAANLADNLVKAGAGTMTLSGVNVYTGTTTVSAGTLVAGVNAPSGSAGAFGNATSAITLGNAATTSGNTSPSLLIGGAFTVGRPVTVANQATTGNYTIGGSTDNNAIFSGAITLNQPLTVSQAANAGANALTISGGITGAGSGTKSLTFAGPGNMTVATTAITDGAGGGNVAVNVTGGKLTLSVADTYTGATSVSNGTLLVNGSIASGAVTVTNATLGGTGTIGGATTFQTNGILSAGVSGIGTLTFANSLTLNAASTNAFVVTRTGGASNGVVVTGALTINSSVISIKSGTALHHSTNTLFNYSGGSDSGTFNPSVVFDVAPPGGAAIVDTGTLIQLVVSNIPPVAGGSFTNYVTLGQPSTVQIVGGKYAPTDGDGDALSITITGAPANGSAGTDGTNITYTASSGTTDSLTYTVSDSYGGSATQTIYYVINTPAVNNPPNVVNQTVVGGTEEVMEFLGIPGFKYALDETHYLTPPTTWTPVVTNTAASDGTLHFTNTVSGVGVGDYYRTRYVP